MIEIVSWAVNYLSFNQGARARVGQHEANTKAWSKREAIIKNLFDFRENHKLWKRPFFIILGRWLAGWLGSWQVGQVAECLVGRLMYESIE